MNSYKTKNLIKSDIADYWDNNSAQYDHEFGGGISCQDEKHIYNAIIKKNLRQNPGAKVLDVGCGTGVLSIILANLGYKVTGIDISNKMLDRAIDKNKRLGLDILFSNGDAEAPPFEGTHFDAIFSRHLIWTLTDPEKAVANFVRLLKPGGVLLTIDGIWIHKGFGPRVRRFLANILVSLKTKRIHRGWTNYYAADEKHIPLFGGTGPQSIVNLYNRHGLSHIWTDPLDELIAFERQHAPMEYRILYTKNPRYLVGGIKEGD